MEFLILSLVIQRLVVALWILVLRALHGKQVWMILLLVDLGCSSTDAWGNCSLTITTPIKLNVLIIVVLSRDLLLLVSRLHSPLWGRVYSPLRRRIYLYAAVRLNHDFYGAYDLFFEHLILVLGHDLKLNLQCFKPLIQFILNHILLNRTRLRYLGHILLSDLKLLLKLSKLLIWAILQLTDLCRIFNKFNINLINLSLHLFDPLITLKNSPTLFL